MTDAPVKVAIVDYGMGNLFSVKLACEHVGMSAEITGAKEDVLLADVVILPGVGAFGDAMACLRRLDLVGPIKDAARAGKPLMGICLGLQLLMTESYEFGRHEGLDIFSGPVVRFESPMGPRGCLKVPQIGWNRIFRHESHGDNSPAQSPPQDPWESTPLRGLPDGEYMYFVHSFYAKPDAPEAVLSWSRYGHIEFCSSLRQGSVFATQFHPERSGVQGLRIYRELADLAQAQTRES
jgi:glutamine amidotransferase